MDAQKRKLKGSPYRDAVKQWHKTLGSGLSACDNDLVLISFKNAEGVVVCLDAKKPGSNELTSTHRRNYDWFEKHGVPVYLLTLLDYEEKRCSECGKIDISIRENSRIILTKYSTSEQKVFETKEEYIEWEKSKRNR